MKNIKLNKESLKPNQQIILLDKIPIKNVKNNGQEKLKQVLQNKKPIKKT